MYCGTVPLAVDLYQTFPYCRQNTALPSLDSCLVLAVANSSLGDGSVCKYLQVRIYLVRMGSRYNYGGLFSRIIA